MIYYIEPYRIQTTYNSDEAYGAAPEHLYLVGKDENVFYHGGAEPHRFDIEELEGAIRRIESNIKIN